MTAAALIVAAAPAAAADPCGCAAEIGGPAGACGSVRDLRNGTPIEGAEVSAGADPTFTDAAGCYAVAGVFSGPCAYVDPSCTPDCILDCPLDVAATAAGYEPAGLHGYWNTFPINVAFRLAPLAAIACLGDCDGDGRVFVDDIVCRVRLSSALPAAACDCPTTVDAGDLPAATENALFGCLDCQPGSCSRAGP